MARKKFNQIEVAKIDPIKENVRFIDSEDNRRFTDKESFIKFMDVTLSNCTANEKLFVIKFVHGVRLDNIVDKLSNLDIKSINDNRMFDLYSEYDEYTRIAPLYREMVRDADEFLKSLANLMSLSEPTESSICLLMEAILSSISEDNYGVLYTESDFEDAVPKLKEIILGIIEDLDYSVDDYGDNIIDDYYNYLPGSEMISPFEEIMTFTLYAKSTQVHTILNIPRNIKTIISSGMTVEGCKSYTALIIFSMLYCDENINFASNLLDDFRSLDTKSDVKQVYINLILAMYTLIIYGKRNSSVLVSAITNEPENDIKTVFIPVYKVMKYNIIAGGILELIIGAIRDDMGICSSHYRNKLHKQPILHPSHVINVVSTNERMDTLRTILLELIVGGPFSLNNKIIKNMDDILSSFAFNYNISYTTKMLMFDIIGVYDIIDIIFNSDYSKSCKEPQFGTKYKSILVNSFYKINFKDLEWTYLETKSKIATRNAFKILLNTTRPISDNNLLRLSLIDDPQFLERSLARYK